MERDLTSIMELLSSPVVGSAPSPMLTAQSAFAPLEQPLSFEPLGFSAAASSMMNPHEAQQQQQPSSSSSQQQQQQLQQQLTGMQHLQDNAHPAPAHPAVNEALASRLALLDHATYCTARSKCLQPECVKMIAFMFHRSTCQVPTTSCRLCRRYDHLAQHHSRSCEKPVGHCRVPRCSAFKLRVFEDAQAPVMASPFSGASSEYDGSSGALSTPGGERDAFDLDMLKGVGPGGFPAAGGAAAGPTTSDFFDDGYFDDEHEVLRELMRAENQLDPHGSAHSLPIASTGPGLGRAPSPASWSSFVNSPSRWAGNLMISPRPSPAGATSPRKSTPPSSTSVATGSVLSFASPASSQASAAGELPSHELLLHLVHATGCDAHLLPEGTCRADPRCAEFKQELLHIARCNSIIGCSATAYCMQARFILAHWSNCKLASCPTCAPTVAALESAGNALPKAGLFSAS